jgi:hypothetical protein
MAPKVAPRDKVRLKKMHVRVKQLSRRRPRTAKGYISSLRELTAIANQVVRMYVEAANV